MVNIPPIEIECSEVKEKTSFWQKVKNLFSSEKTQTFGFDMKVKK